MKTNDHPKASQSGWRAIQHHACGVASVSPRLSCEVGVVPRLRGRSRIQHPPSESFAIRMAGHPASAIQHPASSHAFTLIELLTVIAIVGIMMGLVLGVAGYAARKADQGRAVADLEKIKNALEEHRVEYGRYPHNAEVNKAVSANLTDELWVKPHNDGLPPFLVMKGWINTNEKYSIEDPWGNDYHYIHDKSGNPYAPHNDSRFGYDLWSLGPDMRDPEGSGDDICNWKGDF